MIVVCASHATFDSPEHCSQTKYARVSRCSHGFVVMLFCPPFTKSERFLHTDQLIIRLHDKLHSHVDETRVRERVQVRCSDLVGSDLPLQLHCFCKNTKLLDEERARRADRTSSGRSRSKMMCANAQHPMGLSQVRRLPNRALPTSLAIFYPSDAESHCDDKGWQQQTVKSNANPCGLSPCIPVHSPMPPR